MYVDFVRALGWAVDQAGQTETGNFKGCLHDTRICKCISSTHYSASATEETLVHMLRDHDACADNGDGAVEARKALLQECSIHIVWNESLSQYQPQNMSGGAASPSTRYDKIAIVISPVDTVEHSRHLLRVSIMSLTRCDTGFEPPVIGPLIHGSIIPFNMLADAIIETAKNIASVGREPCGAAMKRQDIIDAIVRDISEPQDLSLLLQNTLP